MLASQKGFPAQGVPEISWSAPSRVNPDRAKLLRWAMVLGILMAGPIAGILVVMANPILVFLAAAIPLGLVALKIGQQHPGFFPLTILLIATATEWYFSKGITPALVLTGLLGGLWLAKQLQLNRRLEFVRSPVTAPALTFIAITVFSLFWGKAMADPLLISWSGGSDFILIQLAQMAVLVFSPFALIMTANLTTSKRHLQLLVYGYLALSTIGVFSDLLRLPLHLSLRGLNGTWAVGLLYGQLLFNNKLKTWLRIVFVIVIGAWLILRFVLGITWLVGWVPVLLMMLMLTFLRSKKAVFVVLVVLLIAVFISRVWWTQTVMAEDSESGNRFTKWSFLFSHHSTWGHWLLGTGPFGYAQYFMTYFPNNAASTHSNYIDLFLQTGVVGCAIFGWLIGAIAQVGYKLYRAHIEDPFIAGFVNTTLCAVAAVLVAMFLGDWFTPFVLNQGLHGYSWTVNSWIFFGALAAVPYILRNEQLRNEQLLDEQNRKSDLAANV